MLLFEQMPESLTTDVLFPACRLLKMGNDCENPGMPMQWKMWVLMLQNAVDVSRVLAYLWSSPNDSVFVFLIPPFLSPHFFSTSLFIQCAPSSAVCWLMLVASCPAPGRVRPPPWLTQVRCKIWGSSLNSSTRTLQQKVLSTFGAKFLNPVRHSIICTCPWAAAPIRQCWPKPSHTANTDSKMVSAPATMAVWWSAQSQ